MQDACEKIINAQATKFLSENPKASGWLINLGVDGKAVLISINDSIKEI